MTNAIILAGGLGTRLGSVLNGRPKPMVEVNGRPFLAYLLDYIAGSNAGIDRVLLSVGYKKGVIMDWFGLSYRGLEIDYAVEGSPLGTGGAIRKALSLVKGKDVFVLNGDSFFCVELDALRERHASSGSFLTLSLKRMNETGRYGAVTITNGSVTGFEEKTTAKGGLINAGVYVLNREAASQRLAPWPEAFSFEREFLPGCMAGRLVINAEISDGYFIDIGVPEDYARAKDELAGGFKGVAG
ncbi:MAG: nucleotidyltransferase family protein [Deltaproteobacteria bacterium]|nr:nucleotidyltransferase family protein [Deltaproteobacteria bacterium]